MKRIVVCDDEPHIVEGLRYLLRAPDREIMVARNGKDAVDLARDWRPHLIVLDIMMPGMDGGEVALALEKDPATENIPIIFMTSLLKKEDENKLTYSNMKSYMAKPYNKDELLAEIAKKI